VYSRLVQVPVANSTVLIAFFLKVAVDARNNNNNNNNNNLVRSQIILLHAMFLFLKQL